MAGRGVSGRWACMAGGVWQGGMHGQGYAWQGGAWQAGMRGRGHVWWGGGMCGRGAYVVGVCMAGGHVWQGVCMPRTPPPPTLRDTVGQCADGTHPTGMHSC